MYQTKANNKGKWGQGAGEGVYGNFIFCSVLSVTPKLL